MTTTPTRITVPAFRGNADVIVSDITPGTIASSRTSAIGVPALFALSASNVIATGSSNPYEDLEYRWEVISGAEGYHFIDSSMLRIAVERGDNYHTYPDSVLRNSETEQVGPEALFRFFVPGTKRVRLTCRGKSAGGYITATATIDLTVTAISGANHFWFDPDAGNNANDGKDPWGFSVSGGVFTNATRRLVKAGAFAAYNHVTATSPTDPLRRYNYVGVTGGTGVTAGLYEIAAKVSDDEIELVTDIGGTDPSNVTTSNGPRASSHGSTLASSHVHHFKAGNTAAHTWGTTTQYRTKTGTRMIAYGSGYAVFVTMCAYNTGSNGQTNVDSCFHGIAIDLLDSAVNLIGWQSTRSGGTDDVYQHLYLSDCRVTNFRGTAGVNLLNGDMPGLWDCFIDNTAATAYGSGACAVFTSLGGWHWFMGGTYAGSSLTGNGHHLYVDVSKDHAGFRWVRFNTGSRNYNLNHNANSAAVGEVSFLGISECRFAGTDRAVDISNSASSFAAPRFQNCVIEGCGFADLDSSGKILFASCLSLTIRDCAAWGLTTGQFVNPQNIQTSLVMRTYRCAAYMSQPTSGAFVFQDRQITPGAWIRDCVLWDTRASADILSFDWTNAANVGRNQIYTPADAGQIMQDLQSGGTTKTFAQYLASIDPAATSTRPPWTDAAAGNFWAAFAPSSSAVTPSGGDRWASWADDGEVVVTDDVGATIVFDDTTGVSALESAGTIRVFDFELPALVNETLVGMTVRVRLKWEPSLLTTLLLVKLEAANGATAFATLADPATSSDPLGDIAVPGGGGDGITSSKYHDFTDVDIAITDPATLAAIGALMGTAALGLILTPRGLSSSASRHAATLHIDSVNVLEVETEAATGGGVTRLSGRLARLSRLQRI